MTARFHMYRPIAIALGAAALFVAPLRAQDTALVAPVEARSAPQVAPVPAGPTMEVASVAVRSTSAETPAAARAPARKNFDQGTRFIILGGVAVLTGIVVGGDGGHAISIVGAVVGLYGLYLYLQE
jgi:hypothetical protein